MKDINGYKFFEVGDVLCSEDGEISVILESRGCDYYTLSTNGIVWHSSLGFYRKDEVKNPYTGDIYTDQCFDAEYTEKWRKILALIGQTYNKGVIIANVCATKFNGEKFYINDYEENAGLWFESVEALENFITDYPSYKDFVHFIRTHKQELNRISIAA